MDRTTCFLVIFILAQVSTEDAAKNDTNVEVIYELSVKDIADTLLSTLQINLTNTTNKRFKELKQKLDKIEAYVIDKDKFAEIIKNETESNDFNSTYFYDALKEDDQLQFLLEKEPKSLYLKMKEKMNRDDITSLLAKSSPKSGRKSGGGDLGSELEEEDDIDTVVDKIIAEVPHDDHKFDVNNLTSNYWDPEAQLKDEQRYHKHDGRRIYRGERTTVRDYPFMASIHVMSRFWCGAVIYWHDLILTSASCLQLMHNNRFFRENPKVLQVRIGSNHSRIGGELIDALEVYFHPGYNPRTLEDNIAVVRLRRKVIFNYHRVPKLVEISQSSGLVPATAQILLLGWGVTRSSGKMRYEPVFLQRKFLPVYPNQFCKEVYGDKFITSTMFCAGTMTTGEGACDHDAGGPALVSGRLVGIISFGPTVCGFPNAPTVFTLVGAFADWIETINETMPEYYRGQKRTTTTERVHYGRFTKKQPKSILPPIDFRQKTENQETVKEAPVTIQIQTSEVITTAQTNSTVPVLRLPPTKSVDTMLMKKKKRKKETLDLEEAFFNIKL